jgi:hypothetical protein
MAASGKASGREARGKGARQGQNESEPEQSRLDLIGPLPPGACVSAVAKTVIPLQLFHQGFRLSPNSRLGLRIETAKSRHCFSLQYRQRVIRVRTHRMRMPTMT